MPSFNKAYWLWRNFPHEFKVILLSALEEALGSVDLLLIGNYRPDKQYSMLQYQKMIGEGMASLGVRVEYCNPFPVFGKFLPGNKWASYLDKYCIYPFVLKKEFIQRDRGCLVHVCDHSNSMYLKHSRKLPALLTCHDLVAIRGAGGEFPGHDTGLTGKMLQKYISAGFKHADQVICVSKSTKCDVEKLFPMLSSKTQVVYSAFNKSLSYIGEDKARRLLEENGVSIPCRFLLHVGNNAWYKNRMGVLRVFARYIIENNDEDLQLVIVGEAFNEEQHQYISEKGILNKVHLVDAVSDRVIEWLYNCAQVFIFPSRFEGFGWPPLEAQACHCPVLCSDGGSLPEVVGNGALIAPWDDLRSHVHNLRAVLGCEHERKRLVQLGQENVLRFTTDRMIHQMCDIYTQLLLSRSIS